MAQYVFSMNRVTKTVPPKRQILRNVSLSFFPGAKIGVLGVNGSGKSSLLKIMAGVDKDIEGEAIAMPGLKIGYLEQEPKLNPDQSVREAVEEGIGGVLAAKKRLDEVYAAYADEDADFDALAAEQGELESIIAAAGSENTDLQLEMAADALNLPPWDARIGLLSGGEKRRVALCRLLLSKPDMLLLDEPTNHLDAESVDWLEQFLSRFPGTVVAITHDRYFLDNAAQWILELDRGAGIPWKGNYSDWLEQKERRLEQEQKGEESRAKAMKKELEWVRSNAKGRQSKSKARLARFEELSDVDYQKRNETNEIFIPVAERLGNEVIEFENVSKSFGDRLLIDNLSFKVPAGAIVGIIGPNGAGKTTLFDVLNGFSRPETGIVDCLGTIVTGLRPSKIAALGIGRTFQIARVFTQMSVAENALTGAWLGANGVRDALARTANALEFVGLTGRAGVAASALTNREVRLLEIARALAGNPRLLLLDETLAGLSRDDVTDVISVVRRLPSIGITVVIIEHTMHAMLQTADRLLVLEHGKVLTTGLPKEVVKNPAVIEAYLGHKWMARHAAS